jgi:putative phage-type endonuclease
VITWDDAPQGTADWLDARLGLLTASNFKAALSKGSARDTLMRKLAAEKAWGAAEDGFKSAAMQRGNDLEAQARINFELDTGLVVTEVGLATNDRHPGMGASLDGVVGNPVGSLVGLEIKCPLASTMAEYHRAGRLPAAYREQIAAQMLICELTTVHFYAWHPDCPPYHLVIGVEHFDLDVLAANATVFVTELNDFVSKLPARF